MEPRKHDKIIRQKSKKHENFGGVSRGGYLHGTIEDVRGGRIGLNPADDLTEEQYESIVEALSPMETVYFLIAEHHNMPQNMREHILKLVSDPALKEAVDNFSKETDDSLRIVSLTPEEKRDLEARRKVLLKLKKEIEVFLPR